MMSNPWRGEEACPTPPTMTFPVAAESDYRILANALDMSETHGFRIRLLP